MPLRSFTVCHPPAPVGLDPQASRQDKLRFVQNIWAAQALARTKLLPSQVKPIPSVLSDDTQYEVEGGRAKIYWNVWTTAGWAAEQRKVSGRSNAHANSQAKVLIQVVEQYCESPMPEPTESTALIMRLEPLEGDLCRFSYISAKGDSVSRHLINSSQVTKVVVDTSETPEACFLLTEQLQPCRYTHSHPITRIR